MEEVDPSSDGGLFIPKKTEKVQFRPPQKSNLGLGVLAEAKRREGGGFKVPRERAITSVVSSIDEEDEGELQDQDQEPDASTTPLSNGSSHTQKNRRRYRDVSAFHSETTQASVSKETSDRDTSRTPRSREHTSPHDFANSLGTYRSIHSRSERDRRSSGRQDFIDNYRNESRRMNHRHNNDCEDRYSGREARGRYEHEYYGGDHGRKQIDMKV